MEIIENILTIILIFFAIVLFVLGMILLVNNRGDERTEVCKRIGIKTNLEFYDWGKGRCGWEESCMYVCKFIDNQGNIVVKNIK